MAVRPKKHLGQHFLKEESVAQKIAAFIPDRAEHVLEIGPGTGVLTKYLLQRGFSIFAVELDDESVKYLIDHFPDLAAHNKIIHGDFLELNLEHFPHPLHIAGNFPYNISTQIFFKVLDSKNNISSVTCMLQKEVARRITAADGSREGGILTLLLRPWYDCEYLFEVPPHYFYPPPKVDSAVIRLVRNHRTELECDEEFYFKVVKAAFNQRRKTLRNALSGMISRAADLPFADQRAEQLSWQHFIEIVNYIKAIH